MWVLIRVSCKLNIEVYGLNHVLVLTCVIGIVNVGLAIETGQLCGIIGSVGSGKSTLLQVILGELEIDSGSLSITGTLSYAAQEPWLFEGSIRQNIVFVEKFDEKR